MRLTLLAAFLAAPLAAQDAENGAALFDRFCATCHGVMARGDGPIAPSLLLQPPDLTTLMDRNGGVLPIIRIITRIDGRDPLVSHGSPMPIYGDFFAGTDVATKAETGQPIMTSAPIVDLLEWLKSVQREMP